MSHGGLNPNLAQRALRSLEPALHGGARRRVRTAGVAIALVVVAAAVPAGAAPDRHTRVADGEPAVLLSESASRPDDAAADQLEQDYPDVDYLTLDLGDLVDDLVTSLQPDQVDPETSCQALVPRDNAVEVAGTSISFTGAEASVCDPGDWSYVVWHGQRRNGDDDVLASVSLAVLFDEDGNPTGATGTIEDGTTGYELMPVTGDTYALYDLAQAVTEHEPDNAGDDEPETERASVEGGDATEEVASAIDGGQPRTGGPPGNRTIQVRFAYANGISANQAYFYLVNRTARTNDSFITSNMPVRAEGLGPVAANYTQTSSIPIDLTRLKSPTDTHMDGLLADFNATTIDALALIVPNAAAACGKGVVSYDVSATDDFLSVSAMDPGCGIATLTHELGHNLTAQHEPLDANQWYYAFPWSYGHYSIGVARDLMSYDTPCGSQGCDPTLQWSDPDDGFVGHAGTPSGTPYRDNDRSVTDASWAASQKGNSSSSNDYIWYRNGSGHTSFNLPNDMEAPYTPLAGDFDGDGHADQFWYFPGHPAEQFWTFSSTTGSYWPHSVTVVGGYRPVVGDFDGDGRDDILWHAPSSAPDSIWWGTADPNDFGTVTTTAAVGGTYVPQAGDIDGDGRDDIVWYAPGADADYIWWGNASRSTFTSGSGSTTISVSGNYQLTLGDHDGDGRDDLSWFQPGSGTDYLWHGMASHAAVGPGNQTSYTQGCQCIPKTGDFNGDGKDDLFWYGPGTEPDRIWWGQTTLAIFASAPGSTSQSVGGTFSPTTGDFNDDGFTDIFWFSFG